MDKSVKDSIIKHINYMVETENINSIELDWFGGEPLLGFEDTIYPLSKKIKEIALKNKLQFVHVITTNGYLATKEMIEKFKTIDLSHFQITLDGVKNIHNKVKKSSSNDSYQVTVNNINEICNILEKPEIQLRINYTKQNLKNITEIIKDFPEKNRKFIKVLFQQVWQLENKNKPQNVEPILNKFKESGFRIEYNRINKKPTACYADKFYQAVINYDGSVFKCTARDFNDHKFSDGKLNSEGIIEWKEQKLLSRFNNSTFENKYCIRCKFLPVCFGPCSQKMLELKDLNRFKTICYRGGVKIGLERLYKDFYQNTFTN
jgi:uncharacterized protein